MPIEGWNWWGSGALSEAMEGEETGGIMAFTPAESKRLIGKAIAAMPEVKGALEKGRVVVTGGTTNAYVAEEILGKPVAPEYFIKGNITHGLACSTSRSDSWIKPFILIDGKPVDRELNEVLMEFDGGDVYIKGANAVDAEGNAGVLVASKVGGNIGTAMGMVLARGAHVIIPVGLEKLVPSVIDASRKCGIKKLKYPAGATLGLIPVVSGTVITEIEALRILTGVHATHVASGGIGGSEGTVVLVVEGPDDRVRAAFKIWEQIKGEPPVPVSPITARFGMDVKSPV
ncbi:MAG TPA: hypothetical protein VHS28_02840 [Chloroflexota bacterium]|nr:hypothetical protein [Chloroflexota bacterium]